MKNLVWNVIYHNINRDELGVWNVFDHGRFREDVSKELKRCKTKDGVCQVKCVSSFLHLFPQLSAV